MKKIFFQTFLSLHLVSPTNATLTSKADLLNIAENIDAIVIGGIKERKSLASKLAEWKISDKNCLVVNTSQEDGTDYLFNGFSKNLELYTPGLFEVFGPGQSHHGKIKTILFEHVNDGIPEEGVEALKKWHTLLSSGGRFEYSSGWSSYTTKACNKSSFFEKFDLINQPPLPFKVEEDGWKNPYLLCSYIAEEEAENLGVLDPYNFSVLINKESKKIPNEKNKETPNLFNHYINSMTEKKEIINNIFYTRSLYGQEYAVKDHLIEKIYKSNGSYKLDPNNKSYYKSKDSIIEKHYKLFKDILKLANVEMFIDARKLHNKSYCFRIKGDVL